MLTEAMSSSYDPDLTTLLATSAALHSHLCPRQVLGVRAGLMAGRRLNLELPRRDKGLLVIAETDGCFVDGVAVATGVGVGWRTLRVEDYGKVAATFVHVASETALRLAPQRNARHLAQEYAPPDSDHYQAMLHGYQNMPDEVLFIVQKVRLTPSLKTLLSRPGQRALCEACGEEIFNERQVLQQGRVVCRACATFPYYAVLPDEAYASS